MMTFAGRAARAMAASRPTLSISRRLIAELSVIYAAASLICCMVILINGWHDNEILPERGAALFAAVVRDAVVRDAGGTARLVPTPAMRKLERDTPGLRFAVVDTRSGAALAGSTPSLVAQIPVAALGAWSTLHFRLTAADGRRRDGLVRDVDTLAGPVKLVWVGGPPGAADMLDWLYGELTEDLLPLILPLSVATVMIVPLAVRRGLAPLRALSAQASRIGPRAFSLRLDVARTPPEIRPLVGAFNHVLNRLHEGFAQQRRFTASVAHELRTPLAILRAQIDSMPDAAEATALTHGIDRMAHMVDQLLAVARLEARQAALQPGIDLMAVARDTLGRLAPIAIGAGQELALTGPRTPVLVVGNAAALENALANLVENALAHAPRESTVDVIVTAAAATKGPLLEVLDRGPGIPLALCEAMFEPFRRGDNRPGGTGLGLAIVRETMEMHGGSAAAAPREGGGSRLILRFPAGWTAHAAGAGDVGDR